MFYVLFGIVLTPDNPVNRSQSATYLLATMGTFGVMGASLFGFAVSLAMERGQGWLQVKRASPMPLPAYFTAKLVSAMLFSAAIALAMMSIGFAFAHVRLAPLQVAELVGMLVSAAIPFGAMGLALGYIAKPNSAPAVVNLVYLPLAFCSGLWIPIFLLPQFLRQCRASSAAIPHQPVGLARRGNVARNRFDRRTCRGAGRFHLVLSRCRGCSVPPR